MTASILRHRTLKSANASLRIREERDQQKQPQRQRLAVFRITAAATAAQTQADSTQSQTSSQAPQQKASVAECRQWPGLQPSAAQKRESPTAMQSLWCRVSCPFEGKPCPSDTFPYSLLHSLHSPLLFVVPQRVRDGLTALLSSLREQSPCRMSSTACACQRASTRWWDYGEEKATQILGAILEGFPPGLVSLKRVELVPPRFQSQVRR